MMRKIGIGLNACMYILHKTQTENNFMGMADSTLDVFYETYLTYKCKVRGVLHMRFFHCYRTSCYTIITEFTFGYC